MEQIEIEIDHPAKSRQKPRRNRISTRILGLVFIVGIILALLVLGSTTPDQSLPEQTTTTQRPTSTTTQTSTTQTPTTTNVQNANEPLQRDDWVAALDASPPEGLSVLDDTLTLFLGGRTSQIVDLNSSGAQSHPVACKGEPSVELAGQLDETVFVHTDRWMCQLSSNGEYASQLIEGAPTSAHMLIADDTSAWFCGNAPSTAELAQFVIGQPLGPIIEVDSCPIIATREAWLLALGEGTSDAEIADVVLRWFDISGQELGASFVTNENCDIAAFVTPFIMCRDNDYLDVVDLRTDEVHRIAGEILPDNSFAGGTASPSGRYLGITRSYRSPEGPEQDLTSAPVLIIDLDTQEIIGPALRVSEVLSFTWLSDTQVIVHQLGDRACSECDPDSLLSLVDVVEQTTQVLLDVPADVSYELRVLS